ncbi:MAG: SDR family oxidoreductase [Actinomycetota bacterium]|nr:SDR family oxidoreductase [Actinomycetota bacterium]
MTGFPGFIARRLVRKLLAADEAVRITALVEGRMADAAREAAAAIDGDRIELVVGDIGDRRLGLDDAEYARLAGEVDVVHHLAAIYDLSVPLALAQRVNVDGTGNVLDFCRACKDFRKLEYVSTAYVAGERTGSVYEHELSVGQSFKNHYESTKFQAEVWVRELASEVPSTIYRPAIVVGDSRTGETQKFDGPYYILRSISRSLRMKAPIAQFGKAGAPFNVVPVDFVVDAIAALSGDAQADGETLHLVDTDPLTAAELTRVLAREYAGREPAFRLPAKAVAESLRLKSVREMFEGAPRESIVYLNHPVRFDTRRAETLLGRHGLRCPRFEEYAPNMVRFFRENETNPQLRPA